MPSSCALFADLQSVHGFRCYDSRAPNVKCQRVLVLAVCLVTFLSRQLLAYFACAGAGADRAGVADDERVGGPLERLEERSFHRRRDRRHGRDLDDALQETAENVARTQSQFRTVPHSAAVMFRSRKSFRF